MAMGAVLRACRASWTKSSFVLMCWSSGSEDGVRVSGRAAFKKVNRFNSLLTVLES